MIHVNDTVQIISWVDPASDLIGRYGVVYDVGETFVSVNVLGVEQGDYFVAFRHDELAVLASTVEEMG